MFDESTKLPGDDDEWIIAIGGYGAFLFRGNEDDAEHMREGKARWERGFGSKWRVDDKTCGGVKGEALAFRQQATASAKEDAEQYGRVATWENYGRSEASERAIAALTNGPATATEAKG